MLNVIDRLGWILDDATQQLGRFFGQSLDAYCDLETAEVTSTHTLVDRTGGMVTLFDIGGLNQLSGREETQRVISRLSSALAAAMNNPAHGLQFVFEYDPDPLTGERVIEALADRMKRGGERNGLTGMEDLIEENAQAVARYTAYERGTLVVTTAPRLLRRTARKAEDKREGPDKTANRPAGPGTQNTRGGLSAVVDAHNGFVDQVHNALAESGVAATMLEAHAACRRIRQQVDREFTHPDWQPLLPGDPIPMADNGRPDPTPTDRYWPRLSRQLLPRDPEFDLRTVTLGDRIYYPLQVEMPPREPKPFAGLFGSLSQTGAPYRVSIRLTGDALSRLNSRRQAADSLKFAGSQNKRISRAFANLEEFVKENQGTAVGMVIDATTWVHTSQADQLQRRANQLASALQAWGNTQIDEIVGAPLDAVTASVAGLRISSPSNMVPMAVDNALLMTPISRPHSPWSTGNMIFRTPDGKLFPYQAFSSMQNTWVSLIEAPPGSGKSVLLNALNLGLCLDPGNNELPIIRIADIGYSSSGVISLLQYGLPRHRQHEALYTRLQLSADYAINILDPLLGARRPRASHLNFIVDFIGLLATEYSADGPASGIPGIAKMVVGMAYDRFSDDNTPKLYNPKISRTVDAAIDTHGIPVDRDTTWWELTDMLMDAGDTVAAYAAQARAVPLLSEVAALARDTAVTNIYQGEAESTREPITEYFWRVITEVCSDYPLLNAPTAFTFGEARVVSLDLQDVAPSASSPQATRQSGIMYTLALWVMTSEFKLDAEDVTHLPPRYRAYHEARIASIRKVKKRVAIDEYHRTDGQPQVNKIVTEGFREGRKHNLENILISQRHTDFSADMIALSTTRLVFGTGEGEAKTVADGLGLGETAVHVMNHRLNGPARDGSGANLLADFTVRGQPGRYTQLLTLTQGPLALWAFSTSRDDVTLRDRLYQKLGPSRARSLLARYYPGGSVSGEVERRNARAEVTNNYGVTSDQDEDTVTVIERELLAHADEVRDA